VTKLPGIDEETDLALGSKKEQADLLTAVLKASDDDADEEVIQSSVRVEIYSYLKVVLDKHCLGSPILSPSLQCVKRD